MASANFNGITAVLLDIEGTTTSISFVKDMLFPFSVDNLKAFLRAQWFNKDVQKLIADLRTEAAGEEDLPQIPDVDDEHVIRDAVHDCVEKLVELDKKLTSLKELQGRIWRMGYENGILKGHLFGDVPGNMRAWKERGLRIFIYSSGSVEAQKLLFKYSEAGDLLTLIDGHFDTRVGGKRDPDSYRKILASLQESSEKVLFLTDIEEEAEAASAAGMSVGLLRRPGNGPLGSFAEKVPVFETFDGLLA